jgi:NADP-dependent 3-hydroxy acid dehydrogenase YdfG
MSDRVFLITGASTGIGAATARAAAWGGFRVVLAARSSERLEALAEELGGPSRALAVPCDVTSWEQQQRMVAAALDAFGQLDVAFANAGFLAERGFVESDPVVWREMVLTNVYGVALTLRATIPALRETRGQLLMTGSVGGRKAVVGSLYSATKWAVTAISEAVRQELNGTGIRVTLLSPGAVATPFWEEGAPGRRPLAPEDVAEAVLFAATRPPHVDVNEILIRPTEQVH